MTLSQRPLKVGVQLPEVEYEARWPEIREMAVAVESLGFDSIWVGDHLLYENEGEPPRGPWEAWTQLAAIAAVTERVQLGPLVACTGFHAPAVLAKLAATVDEISGGRLVLGLGAGWNQTEFRAFGLPFDRRVDRFEEAFAIIRALLRDGEVDFAGRYYEARDCKLLPPPRRAGGPPLMIGSSGERMLRITAPHVQLWNAWYADFGNRPEGIAPIRERVDAACREAGRDPREVERTVAILVGLSGGGGRMQGDRQNRGYEAARGTPDELADLLRAYAREGISHIQLVLDPISRASIEEVAPVLDLLG